MFRAAIWCLVLVWAGIGTIPTADAADTAPTGAFEIQRTLAEVLGEERAAGLTAIAPPDRPVSWEVYVPSGYDPADPPGLLVYISPIQSGRIPENWERELESRNLIWVSANKSGNQVHVQRRALFAVIAPTLIGADYRIDRSRV